MGRVHINLILNSRIYKVGFAGGEATELTANTIAESIYTKFDADGNECLLLEVLVDYHKDNKAIILSEQQTSIWGRPVTWKTTAGWKICCQ